jgi:hypothetical protein
MLVVFTSIFDASNLLRCALCRLKPGVYLACGLFEVWRLRTAGERIIEKPLDCKSGGFFYI